MIVNHEFYNELLWTTVSQRGPIGPLRLSKVTTQAPIETAARAEVYKLEWPSEPLGGLVKIRIAGSWSVWDGAPSLHL